MNKDTADQQEERTDFDGQRSDEQLLFVFRRHIIAMRKGFYLLLIPLAITSIPPLIWRNSLELFWLPVAGLAIGLIFFGILRYISLQISVFDRLHSVVCSAKMLSSCACPRFKT